MILLDMIFVLGVGYAVGRAQQYLKVFPWFRWLP